MISQLHRYPLLYQLNTRARLAEIGRGATLDDLPEADLDRIAEAGFDWVWALSAWTTGEAGRAVSRAHTGWRREFAATLADLTDDDIVGSGFAIAAYDVAPGLGGDAALARLRGRLRDRGLRLMLDFVPNHTARDHSWARTRPESYVAGTEDDLARAPQNYARVGDRILAYGRDPYFDGWPDTFQLDYSRPEVVRAMTDELLRIAGRCDGVRCDMAMLLLPEVFARTWGRPAPPFWPGAIARLKAEHPEFRLMAEVYWDLEWALQRQGFDWTYDKRLYDRLREGHARPVREHLLAGLDFQDRLARFLENHDEPRAAAAFPPGLHEAAAVLTYLTPGLRFFQEGQREGWRVKLSPHLGRRPAEAADARLAAFYDRLLAALRDPAYREGAWTLLECREAWPGNGSHDAGIAFAWAGPGDARRLVAVNYAGHDSQFYVRPPFDDLRGSTWRFSDRLGDATYDRDGDDLADRGLYLALPPGAITRST